MGGEEVRRSVYIQVRRSKPVAFLNSFDPPVMEVNCERRQSSTAPTQALMLMNSDFILDQAQRFAERVRKEAGVGTRARIIRAWQLTLSRIPDEKEIASSERFVTEQIRQLTTARDRGPEEASDPKGSKAPAARKLDPEVQALTSFCQALLSSNEFLYAD